MNNTNSLSTQGGNASTTCSGYLNVAIPFSRLYERKKCNSNYPHLSGKRKNYGGMILWARGYFVSTVDTDEEVVGAYIRDHDRKIDACTRVKRYSTHDKAQMGI